jgi:sulfite reductase (NADPH) hemoprotein beta-component
MYRYDVIDKALVDERVAQFRDQTRRFLAGELNDDEFKHLRLRNGLYIQRHAPMLRVAIPYGLLSSAQLRTLGGIARRYDRGYGHFTTRQNIQYNWPKLEEVPDILADLAAVEMHAIQTSGNCIRNTTSDHLAGVTPNELEDPRPWCEIIRQWSTFHPEFTYLPRKFKIAVTGAPQDRAASLVHDVGVHIVRGPAASWASKFSPAAASAALPSSARSCATSCRANICSPISKPSCGSTTSRDGATTSPRRASRFW